MRKRFVSTPSESRLQSRVVSRWNCIRSKRVDKRFQTRRVMYANANTAVGCTRTLRFPRLADVREQDAMSGCVRETKPFSTFSFEQKKKKKRHVSGRFSRYFVRFSIRTERHGERNRCRHNGTGNSSLISNRLIRSYVTRIHVWDVHSSFGLSRPNRIRSTRRVCLWCVSIFHSNSIRTERTSARANRHVFVSERVRRFALGKTPGNSAKIETDRC